MLRSSTYRHGMDSGPRQRHCCPRLPEGDAAGLTNSMGEPMKVSSLPRELSWNPASISTISSLLQSKARQTLHRRMMSCGPSPERAAIAVGTPTAEEGSAAASIWSTLSPCSTPKPVRNRSGTGPCHRTFHRAGTNGRNNFSTRIGTFVPLGCRDRGSTPTGRATVRSRTKRRNAQMVRYELRLEGLYAANESLAQPAFPSLQFR